MPLSEYEQQVLAELERALDQQDPAFARRVRSEGSSMHPRLHFALSLFGVVAALALLLGFCLTTAVVLGLAGYLIMVASLRALWVNARRLHPRQAE